MSKWNELLKASENRGKGLGEVKDILEFNEQVDKVQDWIREKVGFTTEGRVVKRHVHFPITGDREEYFKDNLGFVSQKRKWWKDLPQVSRLDFFRCQSFV